MFECGRYERPCQDKKDEIQTNLFQLDSEGDDYHGSWWSHKKMRRALSFFDSFHDPSKVYSALDLGCGGMTLTKALRSYPNFQVTGIDLVFEVLKRIAKARFPDIPLTAGDAEFLPFKDESFDIVMHNQVLHHFFRREIILREIRRVLRPNGLLQSIETNGWNPYVRYEHYCRWSRIKAFISKNENPFSLITFRRELVRAGFRLLGWRMINFDFISLLSPFDSFFARIPLFNLFFGGSMLVCSRRSD